MLPKEYYPADIDSRKLPGNNIWGMINIHGENRIHIETAGFPLSDPWSVFFRTNLEVLRAEGLFQEKKVMELDIRDGRDILTISDDVTGVIGVDTVSERLDAAWVNLSTSHSLLERNCPIKLYNSGVEELLPNWNSLGEKKFPDIVLMYLPQSPEGKNPPDVYRASSFLLPFRRWDKYGLTLNAAALANMLPFTNRDSRVVMILSDRIPSDVRKHFIRSMGWEVEKELNTGEPVQQDPDTGVEYVQAYDDGQRFYEKVGNEYYPISAVEAERRRIESIQSGRERKELNVYHHLSAYVLRRGHILQTKELRYGFREVNFFRTTESWSLPIFNMPSEDQFTDGQANIMGITSSGQLLDYASSLGNKLRKLDLIDINPAQNIWAAYLLINMLDFKGDRVGYRNHMTDSEIDVSHVEEDIRKAISHFNLGSYLVDFPELDLRRLAQSFVCYKKPPEVENTGAVVPVDKFTDDNFRFYFTLHDDLFNNLTQIIESGKIQFHHGAIEQFKSPDATQYHGIYLSDVHPWTDQVALLDQMQDLLVSGGSFYFSTYGVDEEGRYNYARRDSPFIELLRVRAEEQRNFSWNLVSPIEQSVEIEKLRSRLGYGESDQAEWVNFLISGPSGYPPRQKIPILVKKI